MLWFRNLENGIILTIASKRRGTRERDFKNNLCKNNSLFLGSMAGSREGVILWGSGSAELGREVAERCEIEAGNLEVCTFADGEKSVEVKTCALEHFVNHCPSEIS